MTVGLERVQTLHVVLKVPVVVPHYVPQTVTHASVSTHVGGVGRRVGGKRRRSACAHSSTKRAPRRAACEQDNADRAKHGV